MSDWIKCSDRLPDEGSYVLVRVLTVRDSIDRDGSRVRVMKIFKGLTSGERKAEELKTGFPRPYGNSDQHENNLVPYKWQDAGACNSFGQEVTHWQPLPAPPTE